MKPSEIKQLAENVKEYVEKNKKIPSKLTINKITYSWPQIWYILSYGVANLNKELKTVPAVVKCKEPTGDNIKEDIKPEDYKKQAKKIVDFINNKDNKNKCPNYVTSIKSKKRIRPRLSVYANARILVWYYNHKKLPEYCTFDSSYFKTINTRSSSSAKTTNTSTSKSTLKPYMTNHGCSGMGQCTSVNCACNSLQQGFYRLTGINVSESTIARWAGTTSSGTSHQGIETAVAMFNKTYKKNVKIKWFNFNDLGKTDDERWKKLEELIEKGAVFCHLLYRLTYGHYEVPQKVGGSNLAILNSLGNSCGSGTYCGYIETRTKATQLAYMKGISQKSICALSI